MTGTNEHEMTLFQVLDPKLANLDDAMHRRSSRVSSWPTRPRSSARVPRAVARRDAGRDVVGARHRRGVPHPGDPSRRGAGGARPGVDVPLHVGDTGVRRRAALHARARDSLRVRQPGPARRRQVHRRRARTRRRSPTSMHRAWIAFARERRSRLGPPTRRQPGDACASTARSRCSTTPTREQRRAWESGALPG